jgi:hypothetical protein
LCCPCFTCNPEFRANLDMKPAREIGGLACGICSCCDTSFVSTVICRQVHVPMYSRANRIHRTYRYNTPRYMYCPAERYMCLVAELYTCLKRAKSGSRPIFPLDTDAVIVCKQASKKYMDVEMWVLCRCYCMKRNTAPWPCTCKHEEFGLRFKKKSNTLISLSLLTSVRSVPSPLCEIKIKANACIQGIMNPSSCAGAGVCFPRCGRGICFFLVGDPSRSSPVCIQSRTP